MGLIVTATTGLALWVVLWSLGTTVNLKSFDAFLIALLILLAGAMVRIVARNLPTRRR